MKALIAILLLGLTQTTFAGNKEFQQKADAQLTVKAKALANGNTFVSNLQDPSQAKVESESQCVAYLNTLPVDQLKGSLFVIESTYEKRGQQYRISSPNPLPLDRYKVVAQDVDSMLRGRVISYEISGCETKCEQERLSFSTYQNKCESEIKLSVLAIGEKTDKIGDSYCMNLNSGQLRSGGCRKNMYLAPY